MKIIKFEDLERLESIQDKINRVPKEKNSRLVEDIKWLCLKLRESFLITRRNDDKENN